MHYCPIFWTTLQEYQVAYVIIKTGNAPRPGTWALEKSVDGGKTFTPWQYFATDNSDCLTYFGHSALLQSFKDDTTVTCTTSYSQVPPFENGEVSSWILSSTVSSIFVALLFWRIYILNAWCIPWVAVYMCKTHYHGAETGPKINIDLNILIYWAIMNGISIQWEMNTWLLQMFNIDVSSMYSSLPAEKGVQCRIFWTGNSREIQMLW